jgi:hypothetical protein
MLRLEPGFAPAKLRFGSPPLEQLELLSHCH